MATRAVVVFLCLISLSCIPGVSLTCQDLDTTACSLFLASKPNLCSDITLASTCQRFCGLCPLECYSCPGAVNSSADCNVTATCSQGEVCMLKTHTGPTGQREYLMSCESKQTCEGLGYGFHNFVGKRDADQPPDDVQPRDKRDVAFHCCDIDFCNYPPEFTTTAVPVTNAPTTLPTTMPTSTLTPLGGCDRDIVFILDGSTTVGPYNHKLMVNFVSGLLQHLQIGPNHTQVAMVEYSDAARVEWYLTDHVTKSDLLHATTTVPFVSGTTATHAAFWLARNSVFTSVHGDRPNAKNVVVLITDGGTNEKGLALTEAKLLRDAGAEFIVIGVGSGVDRSELAQYIHPAGNYFTAIQFQTLSYIQDAVSRLFCT